MRHFAFSALAAIALAGVAHAQETEMPEATPEEPAPEAPDGGGEGLAPASDLPLGTPAEPRIGQAYLREQFGDWSLACVRAEAGADPCQLYQLLLDDEGNPVAEIRIFPLPPGGEAAAGANIVTPLETLLTEGLTLSVDGANPRRYPFTFCNREGCLARVGFTEAEVDEFRRGRAAELTLVPAAAPDETVTLTISLIGFTAGFASPDMAPAEGAPAEDAPAE
jgi:invasion protein IalB